MHALFSTTPMQTGMVSPHIYWTQTSVTVFNLLDIEFVSNTIKNKIYDAIDLFIPKLNRRARQFPKWFTAKLRHRLNCVRTLRRKVKLHPSEKLKIKIKSKESALLYDLTSAKADFETNLIKNFEHI